MPRLLASRRGAVPGARLATAAPTGQLSAWIGGSVARERRERWHDDGVVLLEGLIDTARCDALAATLARVWHDGHGLQLVVDSATGAHRRLSPDDDPRLTRAVDAHVHHAEARALLADPLLCDVLTCLLGDRPCFFQSLVFELGSEQGLHQDTAFVVVDDPLALVGVWFALEDVTPGAGELRYVPGSHRLTPYEFAPGRRHFDSSLDGQERHAGYYADVERRCADAGLPARPFLARKGDVLVWSADLVHGGAPIIDTTRTRRSLVAHACPERATPHFFSYLPGNRSRVTLPGGGATYASQYHCLDAGGAVIA